MKIFKTILVSLLLSLVVFIPIAGAIDTLLPNFTDADAEALYPCDKTDEEAWAFWEAFFQDEDWLQEGMSEVPKEEVEWILGCAIKSGELQMWMLPYFISWVLGFLIDLAGLISILMIMIGAYYYIAGGLTDDKEKGKTIIKYAIGGLVLTMLAWVIVQVLLLAVTA